MKRELLHPSCKYNHPLEASEWMVYKRGKSKGSYSCDLCGGLIGKGDDMVAQSTGLDNHSYYLWEYDYLMEGEGK